MNKKIEDSKLCRKCGLVKPYSEFTKDKYQHNGMVAHCKSCKSKYARDY